MEIAKQITRKTKRNHVGGETEQEQNARPLCTHRHERVLECHGAALPPRDDGGRLGAPRLAHDLVVRAVAQGRDGAHDGHVGGPDWGGRGGVRGRGGAGWGGEVCVGVGGEVCVGVRHMWE